MTEQPQQPDARPRGRALPRLTRSHHDGLTYTVARTAEDVIEAWRLVYRAYRRTDVIDANPTRLHTAPQAVGPASTVAAARIGQVLVSTLTGVVDRPGHLLPIERVYPEHIETLRGGDRLLMEFGLFADRREQLARTAESLMELMRHLYHFGRSVGATDFVMGVHAAHARYCCRTFGFEPLGEPRRYREVNDHRIALLHNTFAASDEAGASGQTIRRYFHATPVDAALFEDRFSFAAQAYAGTALQRWLDAHRGDDRPATSAA